MASFGTNIAIKSSKAVGKLPDMTGVAFGTLFTPHMLQADWTKQKGWGQPEIIDYGPMQLPPQCSALHYGMQCFEGLKAYKGHKGETRLFRPDMNAKRMNLSLSRLVFPTIDEGDMINAVKTLVKYNEAWIPSEKGFSLYIRPAAIGTNTNLGICSSDAVKFFILASPVGPYYASGFKPVKLLVDTKNRRAWPGGTGGYKLGSNYAGPVLHQDTALKLGFSQILWLGPGDVVDEVGAMNFLLLWTNKEGERELITPPLDGTILPGITRDSILSLARQWGEFKVTEKRFTIHEVVEAIEQGRVEEAFGCGTAAIVTAIEGFQINDKYFAVPVPDKSVTARVLGAIQDIQIGATPSDWSVVI